MNEITKVVLIVGVIMIGISIFYMLTWLALDYTREILRIRKEESRWQVQKPEQKKPKKRS